MVTKWAINQAVRESRLPAPARLIVLVLSDLADAKTGIIPEDRTPSLAEIAVWTGLNRSTVTRHLDALDGDGWVIRNRPVREVARRDRVRTTYRLDVPRGAQNTTPVVHRTPRPRGAQNTTDNDPTVVHPAPSQDGHAGQDAPSEESARGAQNTTTVVHPAPSTVVHPAPVPLYTEVKEQINPSSSPKAPKAKPQPPPERPDVDRLCNHLANRIEANGSLRPTITAKWRAEARLLLDKDGRTVEQVLKAIDWCQSDPFWRGNVRSMSKLRTQYDTLRLHAMRPNGRASPRHDLVERDGLLLKPETVANLERRKRFEAMDNATQLTIGGTS